LHVRLVFKNLHRKGAKSAKNFKKKPFYFAFFARHPMAAFAVQFLGACSERASLGVKNWSLDEHC
jgi:hypothetical protein